MTKFKKNYDVDKFFNVERLLLTENIKMIYFKMVKYNLTN